MFDTAPPVNGMQGHFSRLTKLAANTGKLRLICPICQIDFLRPAAWAKRVNVNYCGRGCAAIGKVVEVECFCSVCNASMLLPPSSVGRKTTCGPACSSAKKRSRGLGDRKGSWAAYKLAVKEISGRGVCEKCGTTTGPWAVRGLEVEVADGGIPSAIYANASLWCKHCHLVEVAPLGAKKRESKKTPSNAVVNGG